MRRLSRVLVLSAICALAAPSAALAADCVGADLHPSEGNLAAVGQATLCLINVERAGAGLPPLTEQSQLTEASVAFSQLMVDQHFFAHVAPGGATLTDRLNASGYLAQPGSWTVGENIAWGESYLATPDSIVTAWLNSPPHRANILSAEFDEIGLGIVKGVPLSANIGATYTTDFGRRTPSGEAQAQETVEVVGDEDATSAADVASAPKKSASRKRQTARKQTARKHSTRKQTSRHVRRAAKRSKRSTKRARRALSMRAIRATAAR